MPHDKNGSELKVGDSVVLRGTIEEVQPSAQSCNIKVKIEGEGNYTLTAKNVEKLGKTDTQAAAEAGFSTQHTDKERYPK